MRYFFHIGYNGYHYSGWQKLPGIQSVQHVIERSIGQILKTTVSVVGCGRTDAQVHASQFFFHLDVENEWDFDMLFRLNKTLPADVAIFEIIPMEGGPHARFDAVKRSYDYFIHTYKDPFLSTTSAFYLEKNLDLHKMKEAVALLPRYNDYRALCKSPANFRNTICEVTSARLLRDQNGDKIRFQISANRFLTGMIRIIVGKLLKIGNGVLTVDEFESYLITKETPKVLDPAYAQGLFLSRVIYPFLDIPPRTDFLSNGYADRWKPV